MTLLYAYIYYFLNVADEFINRVSTTTSDETVPLSVMLGCDIAALATSGRVNFLKTKINIDIAPRIFLGICSLQRLVNRQYVHDIMCTFCVQYISYFT